MEIIRDLRILNAIAKKQGLTIDKDYKYITSDFKNWHFDYKGKQYKIQFFDGCFYPFITIEDEDESEAE